jgi:hypothetical protein
LQYLVAQSSASSTAARCSGSLGNNGGSGAIRSRARAILREPWIRSPSIFSAGTVIPGKPSARSAPLEITGIRSTRRYSIPFASSISRAVRDGCELGIT